LTFQNSGLISGGPFIDRLFIYKVKMFLPHQYALHVTAPLSSSEVVAQPH